MITQFDKTTCEDLRRDLNEALREVAKRHGLTLRATNMKYTERACTITVEAGVLGVVQGRAATKESEAFSQLAHLYGLKREDLGRTVVLQGAVYTLIGLKPGASKRPMVLEDASGRRVVCPAITVRQALL